MKPIDFRGSNAVIGKDQPEYLPLPAYVNGYSATSCWKMTWKERLTVLFTGRVFVTLLTFGGPLQPQLLLVNNPVRSERS